MVQGLNLNTVKKLIKKLSKYRESHVPKSHKTIPTELCNRGSVEHSTDVVVRLKRPLSTLSFCELYKNT